MNKNDKLAKFNFYARRISGLRKKVENAEDNVQICQLALSRNLRVKGAAQKAEKLKAKMENPKYMATNDERVKYEYYSRLADIERDETAALKEAEEELENARAELSAFEDQIDRFWECTEPDTDGNKPVAKETTQNRACSYIKML